MGGGMSRNLLKAGYTVVAFDIDSEKCNALVSDGATAGVDESDVVRQSDIVMTSLRSSDLFVQVAETHFLPNARSSQIFIDLGTTTAPETRRLAVKFAERGATLIDAPVSGGSHGAQMGTLRIFVGGDAAVVEKCRPILNILGEPEHVVYCGPSGSGQVGKGVNQLAMGLGVAAYIEAIAFGVNAGVDAEALLVSVGGDRGWRGHFAQIAKRIIEGSGNNLYVKFPELPYFLSEADAQGFHTPLTKALYEFCHESNSVFFDNMKRPTRSFWYELTTHADSDDHNPQD